jgi:hypothetical protein
MSAPAYYKGYRILVYDGFARDTYSYMFENEHDAEDDGLARNLDDALSQIDARERHRLDALAAAQDRADAEERERELGELADADGNYDREGR